MLTQNIERINKKINCYLEEYERDLLALAHEYVYKNDLYHIGHREPIISGYLSDSMLTEIIEGLNIEKIKDDIHEKIKFNDLSKEDKESFLYYHQIYNYEEYCKSLDECIHYVFRYIIKDFEHFLFD